MVNIHVFVQACSNPTANALELLQSWTEPLICSYVTDVRDSAHGELTLPMCNNAEVVQSTHHEYAILVVSGEPKTKTKKHVLNW